MEIITERAKPPDMIIPPTETEGNIRDEVNRRTHKAGYTTRHGDPTYGTKIMGPGIGESKINVWPRDKDGNLIGD
jgi:hypothetical protein